MNVQELIDALSEIEDKNKPVQIPVHYTESQYEEASYVVDEGDEVVIY